MSGLLIHIMNKPNPYYSHSPLFLITPPNETHLALASEDGATSILINNSGVGQVIARYAGEQKVYDFSLPNVPSVLRSLSEPGNRKWLLDQLPIHPRIAPDHPCRVVFSVRGFKSTFTEGSFAFAPAIRTINHAQRILTDYPQFVFVATEIGLVPNLFNADFIFGKEQQVTNV